VSPTLDIIIPVYRGEAETRACVQSVLGALGTRGAHVVVIDDAGPEASLRAWLRSLRDEGRIELVSHAENRGFVASVNEGMALHRDRDVILLNSDTEVAGDWFERIARHAARDPRVGSVTPFSGNATICSYPRTLEANALPEGENTASLDQAFAAANRGRGVDIPTAVGFCMFISRRCLEAVGPFDEARYGRGYGEEVDFCMRASRAGFRHLLAGDVYVRHIGEVSFGNVGADRRLRAQAMVDELYPEFQVRLREFLASDPPRVLRRRADVQRLRASAKPRELFVVSATAGEAREAAATLATRATADCEPLLLEVPVGRGTAVLRWMRPGEEFALFLPGDVATGPVLRLLGAVGISRVILADPGAVPSKPLRLARKLHCASIGLNERAATTPPCPVVAPSGERDLPEIAAEWLAPPARQASSMSRLARWLRGG
jgi:GT2 family glycosyltransferase